MNSQIFKKIVPKEILYNLLKQICIYNNEYYVINKISYKKALYLDLIDPFLSSLLIYYHISKQHYLKKKQTYTSFITIIRQLCKFHNLKYISKILYSNSDYNIVYHIYE